MSAESKRIVFFHPDLGIGGAERLIVDAAVGLQSRGHKVTIFTSHCDPRHCFEEARDGTLDVRVRGNTIFPPTVLNRLHILLATLRQIHLVLAIGLFSDELYSLRPEVFIVDQLSACVPLLRWLYPRRQRTLFYCHFPDQLLAKREGLLKRGYRRPFDWFEGWSMAASDKIVVNSNFTKSVAQQVFPRLRQNLGVIYPCVDAAQPESTRKESERLWGGRHRILLSINRFERKKDITLAIRAYLGLTPQERRGTKLVIAGGYDQRVTENVEYHKELETWADESKLKHATARTMPTALALPEDIQIVFLLSIPEALKTLLLESASLLVYTPQNEHFGIVPVEAMKFGVPVLASNTGGPRETIVEGETGWLRDVEQPEQWTEIMRTVIDDKFLTTRQSMSRHAQDRVKENFTKEIMARRFDEEIQSMLTGQRSEFIDRGVVVLYMAIVGVVAAALLASAMRWLYTTDSRTTEFIRADRAASSERKFTIGSGGVVGLG